MNEKYLDKLPYQKCPEHIRSFIKKTSLEEIIYWKTETLIDKFGSEPPKNFLKTILLHVQKPIFLIVLKKTSGNQLKAARMLGCNRNTFSTHLKKIFELKGLEIRKKIKKLTPK